MFVLFKIDFYHLLEYLTRKKLSDTRKPKLLSKEQII
jgi:hypothetical protein